MLVSVRISLALSATCFMLAALASGALAGEPATVTVRVEGLNGVTLVPQTQVTTTTTAIAAEGHTCSGTSAGGALYDAVHGNWVVKYGSFGYEIDGIAGLDFPPFSAKNPPDAFWAFWLNDAQATEGACGQELAPGADVVFAAQCSAIGPDCSGSATAPDHFLTSSSPSAAAVEAGAAVSVSIGSLSTVTGSPESSLPGGVSVSAGPVSATPNAQGVATLTFSAAGTYTIQAHAPDAVPSDPYTVCVHNGDDGNCGTTRSSAAPGSGTPASNAAGAGGVAGFRSYTGPFALVARANGLLDGHVYRRAHAPRVFSGSILGHGAVSSVSLELRRENRGRCYAYDGTRERFLLARCGHGSFFKVSSDGSYSYLLPSALAPGRYVLDIRATDAAGNRTTLARGTSRIVFYVR